MKSKEDVRQQIISKVNKIVVKIGTGVLTTEDGYVDKKQIQRLAEQVVGSRRRSASSGSCSVAWGGAWRWGTVTFILGAMVEVLQLGIPGRTTSLTDVFTLAIGGFSVAASAKACGAELLDLLAGGVKGPVHRWLLIMVAVILISKLGPFDLTLDVSSLRGDARAYWKDPWKLKRPPRDEWNSMAQFVLLGALAGSLRKSGELPYRVCPAMGIATFERSVSEVEGCASRLLRHCVARHDDD